MIMDLRFGIQIFFKVFFSNRLGPYLWNPRLMYALYELDFQKE